MENERRQINHCMSGNIILAVSGLTAALRGGLSAALVLSAPCCCGLCHLYPTRVVVYACVCAPMSCTVAPLQAL